MKQANRWGTLIALGAFLTMAATPAHSQESHPAADTWDYGKEHGPEHWGGLDPAFGACQTGHGQSPIDIQRTQKADLPLIAFDYHASPLRIVDNGHTIMISYAPGSSIRVGDRQYDLKQFHFHRPSEEKINGKRSEMDVHLVHADASGRLAVVAVLLTLGQESPVVRELWNDLPKQKDKEELRDDVQIDAANLLPRDRGYYTFEGSLTTPPLQRERDLARAQAAGVGLRRGDRAVLRALPGQRSAHAAPVRPRGEGDPLVGTRNPASRARPRPDWLE